MDKETGVIDSTYNNTPTEDILGQLLSWYNRYKTIILAVLAIILLSGVGIYWYITSSQKEEEEAKRLLFIAERYYASENFENALYGDQSAFTVGYTQIIDNYDGTKSANIARYYAALIARQLENNEEALTYIKDYDHPDGLLGVNSLALHASLLSDIQQYTEAAKYYIKAAEWFEHNHLTPTNFLRAAECFYELGDTEQSKRLIKKIESQYLNTDILSELQYLKGKIDAKESLGEF